MSLSNREKALLAMDNRTCCRRSLFSSTNDWNYWRDKCKQFHLKYFAQCEANERELLIAWEQSNGDCVDAENNEDDDLSSEGENHNMFAFARSIPDDAPATKSSMSE